MEKEGYVYILTNKNHTVLYIGVTSDISRRISEHKFGKVKGFAHRYQCEKVVYIEDCGGIEQAIVREKKLKNASRVSKERWITARNPTWATCFFDPGVGVMRKDYVGLRHPRHHEPEGRRDLWELAAILIYAKRLRRASPS